MKFLEKGVVSNMNFIFVSPNFPTIYSQFVKELRKNGATVLGIGDTPYDQTNEELRTYINEYYYVSSLADKRQMEEAVRFFEQKYGHIDFLESNNEFWLMDDAELREKFRIDTGFYPADMEKIKYKSKMKEYFLKAGAKVARYILVSTLEKSLEFALEVGYPLFVKPDNGVGAAHSYKLSNEEELRAFHEKPMETTYIMEEFIDGELMSFDGICDIDGNVVVCVNEHFPDPIAEVVNKQMDLWYYCDTNMPGEFRELGKRVVKAFGISKRCFHIEFFQLKKAKKGLGEKGDYVGLEVNMRSPGGDTPELICLALGESYYKMYADTICYNEITTDPDAKKSIAVSAATRDANPHKHSFNETMEKYGANIKMQGRYPDAIAFAMGNQFYIATFDTLDEALEFEKFVLE